MGGYGWTRLLPLVGAVAVLSLLHIPGFRPTALDWVVALAAALCVLAGARFPLTVLLVQCALVFAASLVAGAAREVQDLGGGVAQILASVALGEVALRRPGPPVWIGAAALTVAASAHAFPLYSIAANVLIIVLDVGLPVLLGTFIRTQRELARQAELRAVEAERRRGWEVGAARTAERTAVARELHDVVAHHVAAIVLRAGVARHVVPNGDPDLLDALDDVHSIGGQALTDLRKLVAVLRNPAEGTDPALLAAADLSTTLDEVLTRTRQAGVEVRAHIDPVVVDDLDTVHRHAVWRVVQEGLTNVLKHAGPGAETEVTVRRDEQGGLLVEVIDDGGLGATMPPVLSGASPGSGHGLIVMRERVELLDGTLRAGPCATGWALRATLPDAMARVAG